MAPAWPRFSPSQIRFISSSISSSLASLLSVDTPLAS